MKIPEQILKKVRDELKNKFNKKNLIFLIKN